MMSRRQSLGRRPLQRPLWQRLPSPQHPHLSGRSPLTPQEWVPAALLFTWIHLILTTTVRSKTEIKSTMQGHGSLRFYSHNFKSGLTSSKTHVLSIVHCCLQNGKTNELFYLIQDTSIQRFLLHFLFYWHQQYSQQIVPFSLSFSNDSSVKHQQNLDLLNKLVS